MIKQIEPRDLKAMLDRGERPYLLDVRQPWENALAALPDSVLVPLDQLQARVAEVAPPPGALVVAYCHHGVRSLHAAAFLDAAGHPGVASLAGGIDRWSTEVDPGVRRY